MMVEKEPEQLAALLQMAECIVENVHFDAMCMMVSERMLYFVRRGVEGLHTILRSAFLLETSRFDDLRRFVVRFTESSFLKACLGIRYPSLFVG